MQFNSYSYLLLLAAAVTLYWWIPAAWRRQYVLVLSILFYAIWHPVYILLPFLLCGGVYFCGRRMMTGTGGVGLWMRRGIWFVLSILAFFKYRIFVVQNLNLLLGGLGIPHIPAGLSIALPLGISFYSFEAISYLIDKRQGRIKQESFLDLCLFVTFWPHMIAGPIVRFRELVPQFHAVKKWDWIFLMRGLDRLVLGLVQKNLIANNLADLVAEGFSPYGYGANSSIDNWVLALAFGLQIYFDFAAYSNMAIGAANLIGITLPENFRTPYHAKTPPEFWSRWHMTLSRWIRDYLFFPINAKYQEAGASFYISLVGIMALVGLWHGAGWGFVIWGIMHGCYLTAFRWWENWRERKPAPWKRGFAVSLAWRLATIAGVFAAWIPFRAASFSQAATMLREMFFGFHFTRLSFSTNYYLVTMLIALYCLVEPRLGSWIETFEHAVQKHPTVWITHAVVLRPAVYAIGIVLFMIFDNHDYQFIYFQF